MMVIMIGMFCYFVYRQDDMPKSVSESGQGDKSGGWKTASYFITVQSFRTSSSNVSLWMARPFIMER